MMADFRGFYPIPGADGTVGGWMSIDDIRLELGHDGSGLVEVIPAGWTDLASIPRWLHWLFNPWAPDTALAAAIHDGLLRLGYDQRVAAGEFYRRLAKDGVPMPKRVAYYLAVLIAIDRW